MKTLIIFATSIFIFFTSCKKEPGKLSGVITYYFNENFGDKPDVGSKIYVLNANEVDTNRANLFDYYSLAESMMNVINLYEFALSSDSESIKTYHSMVKYSSRYIEFENDAKESLIKDKKYLEEQWKSMKEIVKISSKEQFVRLDEKAFLFVNDFTNNKNMIEYAADGNGTFSGILPAGKYFAFVESNHRNGKTHTELLHKLYFVKFELKPEGEQTINHSFK